jgi:methionyl-tRNA formyltransferase
MRIVLFAYQAVGHAVLEELLGLGAPVAGVFTHEDDPRERRWFPSVAERAKAAGIPVFTPAKLKTPEFLAGVAALEPELFISAYYRRILPPEILRLAKSGVNLHGSLLPKYRGAAPANWQLINGENESGATLHFMSETVDQGAIIDQWRFPLDPDDTIVQFYEKLLPATRGLIRRNFPGLQSGRLPAVAQDESQATVFARRTPADGEFWWNWPALRIHNLVRALTHPFPGAWFMRDGRKYLLWKTARIPPGKAGTAPLGAAPGTIITIHPTAIELITGGGQFLIARLQPEGGEEQNAAQWARAAGLKSGDRL